MERTEEEKYEDEAYFEVIIIKKKTVTVQFATFVTVFTVVTVLTL